MGDTYEYLVYAINIGRINYKAKIIYECFGDVCSKIEFIETCSGKKFISLSKVDILRIEVEDMENTC